MPDRTVSEALFERLTESALAEFIAVPYADDLYVAQAEGVPPLGPDHLETLERLEEDRLDDPGSVGRLVEISRMVDAIQDGTPTLRGPQEASGFVSETFARIAGNVRFLASPLSPAQRTRYERALAVLYAAPAEEKITRTSEYEEFLSLRASGAKMTVRRLELLRRREGETEPSECELLDLEIASAEEMLAALNASVEAIDLQHGMTHAETEVAGAERAVDALPLSVTTALSNLDLLRIADPIHQTTHVACEFFPSRLQEDSWTPIRLTREDLGAGATLNGTRVDRIDLELQSLVVDRPWLWQPLFDNAHWDWKTPSRPVSTEDPGVEALMPAFVHALVFARQLVIQGRAGESSLDRVTPATRLPHWARLAAPMVRPDLRTRVLSPATPVVAAAATIHRRSLIAAGRVQPLIRRTLAATAVPRPPIGRVTLPSARIARLNPAVLDMQLVRLPLALGRLGRSSTRGRVLDERGQPVVGATVSLVGTDSGVSRTVRSARGGTFAFGNLAPARHRVRVTCPGFKQAEGTIETPSNEPTRITLRRTGDCRVTLEVAAIVAGHPLPFEGEARLVITGPAETRLEELPASGRLELTLPAGPHRFALDCPAALAVRPKVAGHILRSDRALPLSFEVEFENVLRRPAPQLIAVVCRRVPPSPSAH